MTTKDIIKSQKYLLYAFHHQLVRKQDYNTANLIVKFFIEKKIFISDNNEAVWDSGLGGFLQDRFQYKVNKIRRGFTFRMGK